MAKRHIHVDATSSAPKRLAITNWELCVLCQEDTGTALQHPYAAKGKPGIGYKSIADHLTSFNELGHMPMNVDIEQLNDGDGIEATLMRHQAGWHKACRLKFSQLKLDRLQEKSEEGIDTPSSVHTRSNQNTVELAIDKCFFCNEPAGSDCLHNASTYDIDVKVRRCALELEDTALLAKLVPGDMIALEAKYHRKCLTNLYNRARTSKNAATKLESDDDLHGIAFAELVTFMEDFRREGTVAPVFKLSDLADMYRTRLEQLGAVIGSRIHTSRLKIRLMAVFPDLKAHTQGKNVILTFDGDVSEAFKKACDYDDDATKVFLPYVSNHLQTVSRIDIVWDVYLKESLKSTTREKRGKGVRRRVAPTTVLPPKWSDFLHVAENKTDLFQFLSEQVIRLVTEEGKCIYSTNGTNVICSLADADFSNLAPCSHEEADTRLFLHVSDAVRKGCRKVCVRTVDTDVIVIAIAMYRRINLDELWISFGTKSNFRYISIHKVVADMDHHICTTLPMFHAFTGCDTVSSFCGRGKKTEWNAWNVFPEAKQVFEALQLMQTDMNESTMATVERFVVLLYNRTSDIMNVNESRKYLFTQKGRSLENLPPTLEVLKQHTKRAIYQSYCWNRALFPQQELPDPADWPLRDIDNKKKAH